MLATFNFTSASGPDAGLAQQIILTIDGENDTPTVTVTNPAPVQESSTSAIETVTIADQVAIADPDSSDVPVPYEANSLGFASVTGPTPPAGTLEDLFTIDAIAGTISYDRQAFNFLAGGQQVLATFDFTSASGPDAGLVQQITLTITDDGTNVPPTVTVTNPAAVTESDDPAAVTVTIADQVTITDPDVSDVPVPYEANSLGFVSATGPTPSAGTLESLFTLDTAAGTINYDRQAFNYLAVGQQVIATFNFTSGFRSRHGPGAADHAHRQWSERCPDRHGGEPGRGDGIQWFRTRDRDDRQPGDDCRSGQLGCGRAL